MTAVTFGPMDVLDRTRAGPGRVSVRPPGWVYVPEAVARDWAEALDGSPQWVQLVLLGDGRLALYPQAQQRPTSYTVSRTRPDQRGGSVWARRALLALGVSPEHPQRLPATVLDVAGPDGVPRASLVLRVGDRLPGSGRPEHHQKGRAT